MGNKKNNENEKKNKTLIRILFFRPTLNVLTFLTILGLKYCKAVEEGWDKNHALFFQQVNIYNSFHLVEITRSKTFVSRQQKECGS